MPPWEVNWIEGIEDDFLELGFNETRILKIKSKMSFIANSPFYHTERVKGVPFSTLRKVKFGDFRLFVFLEKPMEIIYCLAFLPRKNCYDKISLNKVLTIVKNIYKS